MYIQRHKVVWGGVVLSLLAGGVIAHYLGWGGAVAAAGHSVEFNLARLSPKGEAVGYAVPASGSSVVPTVDAVCNADGGATFTWSAPGAVSYNYSLDNKTRGGWEFASQPCSASPINGDYCAENVMTTSLTVGSGSVTPQEYAFNFRYNVSYTDYYGAEGGGSVIRSFLNLLGGGGNSQSAQVINTYNGGTKTVVCGAPPPPPTSCSISVGDCDITTSGGTCDATASWSATGVLDNQVKVALVWPNGYEDLWSRYGWPPFGYAPAVYNGIIAGFGTPGAYTAKVYDKSNNLCATDIFNVTTSVCPITGTTTITDFAEIKNRCDAQFSGTLPAGTTYPDSLTCAPPTAPLCALDCPCVPKAPTGLPNLQSVPVNLAAVQGGVITKTPSFDVGEVAVFIGTTWNVGDAALSTSTPYVDRFQYRLASSSDPWTNIGSINGVPLGTWPGGTNGGARNELATTTFSVAGTYEVRHCADATSQVLESSETDNCSDDGGSVLTVTVNPGGGTSAVQGFKVNESMIATGFASVPIRAGGKNATGNPYQIVGLAAGTVTVTSDVPSGGYAVQYCVQSLPTKDCTDATHYTNGASVSITLATGETKAVWWRYIPNIFAITFEAALIGTDTWGTSLTTTDAQRHVKLRWDSPEANDGCVEQGTGFDTGVGEPNSGQTADTASGAGAVTEEPKTAENPTGSKTYQIKCTKDGTSRYKSVTITDAASLPPTVDIRAKAGLVRNGQVAQLGWTVVGATSCTLSGGGLSYTTTTDFNRNENVTPYSTGPLTATQVFTMECQNSIGLTGKDSVRVEVSGSSQEI